MFDLITAVVTASATTLTVLTLVRARRPRPALERILSVDLVRTMIESAPTAIVIHKDNGTIAYTNTTARELFFDGATAIGTNLLALLADAPEALRSALLGAKDDLFSIEVEGERETYHLSKRTFDVGGEPHTLMLVKHLTHELNRQEVEIWKKVIRVISHELNNSLAPISSLMHSARILVQGTDREEKLDRVFDTVGERVDHLKAFLEGYARFARMPKPRKERVAWGPFLEKLRTLFPEASFAEPPNDPGYFDPAQVEQVIINLMKNAAEAGSRPEDITLGLEETEGVLRIVVSDRGEGLREDVLRSALLPFYSTKERGTGLGLALSREIVEAHGGRLRIQNRDGGGAVVSCILPRADERVATDLKRLTLTQ